MHGGKAPGISRHHESACEQGRNLIRHSNRGWHQGESEAPRSEEGIREEVGLYRVSGVGRNFAWGSGRSGLQVEVGKGQMEIPPGLKQHFKPNQ